MDASRNSYGSSKKINLSVTHSTHFCSKRLTVLKTRQRDSSLFNKGSHISFLNAAFLSLTHQVIVLWLFGKSLCQKIHNLELKKLHRYLVGALNLASPYILIHGDKGCLSPTSSHCWKASDHIMQTLWTYTSYLVIRPLSMLALTFIF